MNKKLFFITIVLSLVLIGGVNAHQDTMHHHITREAIHLLQMSFPGKSPEIGSYVGNLGINSFLNNPFNKQLNYQHNNCQIDYMRTSHFLLDKNNLNPETKRPLKVSKICKQFIIGELIGCFLGFGGTVFTDALMPKPDNNPIGNGPDFYGLEYRLSAFYLGYVIGNSMGVYIAGNDKYEKCSYFPTLGGSILGALIGVGTFVVLDNKDIGACLSILGPPIGSILGFNLSREPREMPHGQALINYDQGGLKWSLSNVSVYYDYYNKPVLNVNLFQANF